MRNDVHFPDTPQIIVYIISMSDIPSQIEAFDHALTAKQVARFTGLSAKTVYNYAEQALLPCYRIGANIRFDPKDVAGWLRGKKQ